MMRIARNRTDAFPQTHRIEPTPITAPDPH